MLGKNWKGWTHEPFLNLVAVSLVHGHHAQLSWTDAEKKRHSVQFLAPRVSHVTGGGVGTILQATPLAVPTHSQIPSGLVALTLHSPFPEQ